MLLNEPAPNCTLGKLLIEDGRELVPCFSLAISSITRPEVRWKKSSIREFKLYVYGKRQTSDSSWEFLKIEREQIKTAQKILMDRKIAGDYLSYV